MKPSVISKVLLATSIAVSAPLAASAAQTAAPIAVSDVNVQPSGSLNQSGPGFISLAFANTSNVTANEVVFELNTGSAARQIDDVGSFAPGATIRHAFYDLSSSPDQQIKVIKVQYADGSTWSNADMPVPTSRRQAS
jgi:hypothetical protein